MPKLPRDVSPDRLVRFLHKRGWRILRQGGRHLLLSDGNSEIAIPRHGPLKTGTLAAILGQAGVPASERPRL